MKDSFSFKKCPDCGMPMIEIFQNIDNCPEWHCQYCGAYANFITGRLSEHGDPKRIAAVQKDGDDSAIAEAYRHGFADGFKKARGNKQ